MRGRRVACLLAVLAVLAGCASSGSEPRVAPDQHGRMALVLPPLLQRTIDDAHPGFRPWSWDQYHPDVVDGYVPDERQVPWAVVADLNGDGRSDLVVDGRAGERAIVLCLLSNAAGGYGLVSVPEGERPVVPPGQQIEVLLHQPPGPVTPVDGPELMLRNVAFHRYFWEKGGTLYVWGDGRFQLVLSSD